jgi:hypothetical protein
VRKSGIICLAKLGLLWGIVGALGGCVTYPYPAYPLEPPPPYMLLPVDEMMTCDAIAGSFQFSARRAARLEYWLAAGPVAGYGYERFPLDAPRQLIDERRRLDALSDLQRYRGCAVLEPGPAVVYERMKLEGATKRAPVVLRSRG